MPAEVIAAGVTAAGVLGGSALKSRSDSKASAAQERAAMEALRLERENEARRRQEYDQQQAMLKAQWEAEQARRAPFRAAVESVLRRRGYAVPREAPATMPAGWTPAVNTSIPKASALLAPRIAPYALGAGLGSSMQPTTPPLVPPKLTLGNLSDWSKLYG